MGSNPRTLPRPKKRLGVHPTLGLGLCTSPQQGALTWPTSLNELEKVLGARLTPRLLPESTRCWIWEKK